MIRGTDGLDYKDITDRLVGKPLKSWRNHRIQALRAEGAPETTVRAYIQWCDGPKNAFRTAGGSSKQSGRSADFVIFDDLLNTTV